MVSGVVLLRRDAGDHVVREWFCFEDDVFFRSRVNFTRGFVLV